MAEQIRIIQLIVDFSLVGAVLIFAMRYFKGNRTQNLLPRTMELEASLKSLLAEADSAGRGLNDQLLRREQSLQKLLVEVDATEQRIAQVTDSAAKFNAEVGSEVSKAKSIISEVEEAIRELKSVLQNQEEIEEAAPVRRGVGRTPARPAARQPEYEEELEFEDAEDQEEEIVHVPVQTRSSRATAAYSSAARAKAPQRNMPVGSSARSSQRAVLPEERSPRVERRLTEELDISSTKNTPTYHDQIGQRELQQVYEAAENMLKEGEELKNVSVQTRLPLEQVQLLSQMIEIERGEAEASQKRSVKRDLTAPPTDNRLGALGAVRRQNTTL